MWTDGMGNHFNRPTCMAVSIDIINSNHNLDTQGSSDGLQFLREMKCLNFHARWSVWGVNRGIDWVCKVKGGGRLLQVPEHREHEPPAPNVSKAPTAYFFPTWLRTKPHTSGLTVVNLVICYLFKKKFHYLRNPAHLAHLYLYLYYTSHFIIFIHLFT